MTREEAIKVLSILKAAYPNSYKGMGKEEANGVVMVWATQFSKIPYKIVLLAVNKAISKEPFPPAISEVRKIIKNLYYEAQNMLYDHNLATKGYTYDPYKEPMKYGTPLNDETVSLLHEIMDCTKQLKDEGDETKLKNLLDTNRYFLNEKN